ncbi:hypothetical protein [Photobacterium damselae]|uniref:hypothetical protein n=1 Tax=Photobacterium damselae TaxID=38293 RepID=UPI001F486AA9|nr:hypothetical protein [Photobacterium damselae]UKA04926.1 hypothetical protein IHC89_22030 [Photobacterium damselae subsp. damselae]
MIKAAIPNGVIEVGDTFALGDLKNSDGALFEGFRSDTDATMLMVLGSPTQRELESLCRPKYTKVLLGDGGAAFLMFKNDSLEFDMSINTKVIDDEVFNSYDNAEGDRLVVRLIVVDRNTSKIAYLGMFTLPVETTSDLKKVVEHQSAYTSEQIISANVTVMNHHSVSDMLEMSGLFKDLDACLIGK